MRFRSKVPKSDDTAQNVAVGSQVVTQAGPIALLSKGRQRSQTSNSLVVVRQAELAEQSGAINSSLVSFSA
jgi:hypothetical protein